MVGEADLLVHVVDGSAPDPEGQIDAVRSVLAEIGADDVPELLVVNKADAGRRREAGEEARRCWPPTRARWSSRPAPARASTSCCGPWATGCAWPTGWSSSSIPYDRGDVLAAVHREGEIVVEEARRGGRPASTWCWTRPGGPDSAEFLAS